MGCSCAKPTGKISQSITEPTKRGKQRTIQSIKFQNLSIIRTTKPSSNLAETGIRELNIRARNEDISKKNNMKKKLEKSLNFEMVHQITIVQQKSPKKNEYENFNAFPLKKKILVNKDKNQFIKKIEKTKKIFISKKYQNYEISKKKSEKEEESSEGEEIELWTIPDSTMKMPISIEFPLTNQIDSLRSIEMKNLKEKNMKKFSKNKLKSIQNIGSSNLFKENFLKFSSRRKISDILDTRILPYSDKEKEKIYSEKFECKKRKLVILKNESVISFG